MKKIFKLVSISALATAVYGVPVANANTATPEACVANDLTLVYDLSELNFDTDGASTRLKSAFQNGVFASQAVSVGAPFDLPDVGIPGTFTYEVDDVVYTDSDPFAIPATSEDTITVKVRFAAKGTLAKGVAIDNGPVKLFGTIMLLYVSDAEGGYSTPAAAFLKVTSDRNIMAMQPAKGVKLSVFADTLAENGWRAISTRDGYVLRGFAPTNGISYETVSVNTGGLPNPYSLLATNAFDMSTLTTWDYSPGDIFLSAAFAQNCDAETTVTACDTSNPTKPICELSVGPMGEVTYNNGCCTGYSLPDATTTE